jgi:hypothetical protein
LLFNWILKLFTLKYHYLFDIINILIASGYYTVYGSAAAAKVAALTVLDKLLYSTMPVSAILFGEWERCGGSLFGNDEYEICQRYIRNATRSLLNYARSSKGPSRGSSVPSTPKAETVD